MSELYPYVAPAPATHTHAPDGRRLAIAGMVLGITSVLFFWWGIASLAQVVLALTFGGIALHRTSGPGGAPGHGQAVAAVTCGIVGAFAYLIFGVFTAGIGFVI